MDTGHIINEIAFNRNRNASAAKFPCGRVSTDRASIKAENEKTHSRGRECEWIGGF